MTPSETPIYLDHAATTPLDPVVWEAMQPWFTERFGNAASRQHAAGRAAAAAVERAREQVAALIGAEAREVIFTSGATESNNLALAGVARAPTYERLRRHLVTCISEHHAVLDPARRLEEEQGFEVSRLGVDAGGCLDLDQLEALLERQPRMVSIMQVNNELGLVHPLAEIGALCRARGVLFHTDAAQGAGKLPLDVNAMQVDLVSLSGHKMHGPQGVGALYLRRRRPRVRCHAMMLGGGHERGLRSGTLNVAGIVGLGAAAERCAALLEREAARIAGLRDQLEAELCTRLDGVSVNGAAGVRVAGITNLYFEGVEAESFLQRMEGVAASSSAACTSASRMPSHVLRSLGADEERVAGSVRFSLGRFTTPEQILLAIDRICTAVELERRQGPRAQCP